MPTVKTGVADFGSLWRMRGGYPPPETEYHFHAVRNWRFDFAWPAAKVAVEIEGGTFSKRPGRKSRHTSGIGHHNDCTKYNAAAVDGWCVLKYTAKHLGESPLQCVDQVRQAVYARMTRTEA